MSNSAQDLGSNTPSADGWSFVVEKESLESPAHQLQPDVPRAASAFPTLSCTATATELMKETPYNLIVHWFPGSWRVPQWSIIITGHQPSVSFILSYLERENSSGNQVFSCISSEGSFLIGPRRDPDSGVWSFRYASELIVSIVETVLEFEPAGSCAYYGPTEQCAATIRYWRRMHAFTGI